MKTYNFYDVPETCKMLNMKETAIYKLIKRKKLHAAKGLVRGYLIVKEDVDAMADKINKNKYIPIEVYKPIKNLLYSVGE